MAERKADRVAAANPDADGRQSSLYMHLHCKYPAVLGQIVTEPVTRHCGIGMHFASCTPETDHLNTSFRAAHQDDDHVKDWRGALDVFGALSCVPRRPRGMLADGTGLESNRRLESRWCCRHCHAGLANRNTTLSPPHNPSACLCLTACLEPARFNLVVGFAQWLSTAAGCFGPMSVRMRRSKWPLHLSLGNECPDIQAQMADRDDAGALQTQRESTSAESCAPQDQSLRATATATASRAFGSRRTSGALNLKFVEQAGDSSSTDVAAAESNRSIPPESEAENPELSALRLELALVRRALDDEDPQFDAANAGEDLSAADDSSDTDTIEYRILAFGGGTYRGQARLCGPDPELGAWLPHGLGVLTTAADHTCCGQWLNGTQVNHGTRYGPALHYEGGFGAGGTSASGCHGVGLYTFGDLFVGCWSSASATTPQANHLHPRGLGRLQSSVDALPVDGWFHGLRCAHRCSFQMAPCSFQMASSLRSQPQPLRGLLVADGKLEFWRRLALVGALTTWKRLCCEFSTAQAKSARLLALKTLDQARRAEQRAIHENLERLKTARGRDTAELLDRLARSRVAQEQRMQRRQLYVQRLTNVVKQHDLARACVAKQQSTVETLELELQEIVELLKGARQAQDDCAQHARELHVLKRQIENATVKLNAARFDQQRREVAPETPQQDQEPRLSLSQRSVSTPAKKTPRQREDSLDNNSMHVSRDGSTHRSVKLGQKFVCDVPGCRCGIPRDVFLRVAAALKDE